MTHVSIGSPASHQVIVESDEPLDKVARAAKRLWDQTTVPDDGKEEPSPGPGYGFHTELRHQPDMHPTDLDGNTPLP